MVTVYTGTPGSGKSLHCARSILRMLNSGNRVIANFPINLNLVKKRYRNNFLYLPDSELTPHYLFEFAKAYHKEKREDQSYIFIDEAQRLFPIDRVYERRREWEQFFQLHRHWGFSIILVTQNMSYINKGIRIQAEYEIKHRKVGNYGLGGLILTFLHFPLFVAITYWQGTKERIFSDFFLYKKKLGNLYDTFSNFDTAFVSSASVSDNVVSVPVSDDQTGSEDQDPELLEDEDTGSADFDEDNIESWDNGGYISEKELEYWRNSA